MVLSVDYNDRHDLQTLKSLGDGPEKKEFTIERRNSM